MCFWRYHWACWRVSSRRGLCFAATFWTSPDDEPSRLRTARPRTPAWTRDSRHRRHRGDRCTPVRHVDAVARPSCRWRLLAGADSYSSHSHTWHAVDRPADPDMQHRRNSRDASGIEEVVPLRFGEAQVDIDRRPDRVTFMGADAGNRRPWTLVEGSDTTIDDGRSTIDDRRSTIIVNRNLARRLILRPGSTVTLRGACTDNSSVPPVLCFFSRRRHCRVSLRSGDATNRHHQPRNFARACGDALTMKRHADDCVALRYAILPPLWRPSGVPADLAAVPTKSSWPGFKRSSSPTSGRFSFVLATITMFSGSFSSRCSWSVSTNQRLGEIAALRAPRVFTKADGERRALAIRALVGTGGLSRCRAAVRSRSGWMSCCRDAGYSANCVLYSISGRFDSVRRAPGNHDGGGGHLSDADCRTPSNRGHNES